MFIVVQHTIHDPAFFWESAQANVPNLPQAGVKRVINIFPNLDMNVCTCVWEANSIDDLNDYLRETLGNASSEVYYQINEAGSMGLNK
jgi:hypothetical protein